MRGRSLCGIPAMVSNNWTYFVSRIVADHKFCHPDYLLASLILNQTSPDYVNPAGLKEPLRGWFVSSTHPVLQAEIYPQAFEMDILWTPSFGTVLAQEYLDPVGIRLIDLDNTTLLGRSGFFCIAQHPYPVFETSVAVQFTKPRLDALRSFQTHASRALFSEQSALPLPEVTRYYTGYFDSHPVVLILTGDTTGKLFSQVNITAFPFPLFVLGEELITIHGRDDRITSG